MGGGGRGEGGLPKVFFGMLFVFAYCIVKKLFGLRFVGKKASNRQTMRKQCNSFSPYPLLSLLLPSFLPPVLE